MLICLRNIIGESFLICVYRRYSATKNNPIKNPALPIDLLKFTIRLEINIINIIEQIVISKLTNIKPPIETLYTQVENDFID